ncbi:MAG: DMT family transporter [Candidatus Dormibacteria bacterium]
MTRRGWVLFTAMAVIWGVPYLLIKVAVADLSPVALVFMRTAIGAGLLLPVAAARHQLRPLLSRWRPLVAYSAIEVGLPWLLLSDAERQLSSSLTGLLIAAVPLVGVALARIVGSDDTLDARRIAGLLVGIAGVGALLGLDVGRGNLRSVAELGVVSVCYAVGPMIIARRLAHLPATGVVASSLALCAVVYAPVALTHLPAAVPHGRVVLAMLALGVVCTAFAFLFFFALIAEVGPIRATIITYVNPAVAVALGVAVLGERFTVGIGVGFALILAGSYLSTRRVAPRDRPPVTPGAATSVASGVAQPAPAEHPGVIAPAEAR